MTVIRLPRLPLNLQVTDTQGRPLSAFARWWDQVTSQIEENLNRTLTSQDAADAAQAAADAAHAAAVAAQGAADAAQASADAANAAVASLGTAAHANTGASGHTLPFCDGANTLADLTATRLRLPVLKNAVDDTAAAAAGVAITEVYRNGSILMVRVT